MVLLLTGAGGNTSPKIASIAERQNIPYLLASRKGQAGVPKGLKGVTFDWSDKSTWNAIFSGADSARISAVYIVWPPLGDAKEIVCHFVDFTKSHGVKRVVLCVGDAAVKGYGPVGEAWQYIEEQGLEYSILKPSWFMDNLFNKPDSVIIMEGTKIYTATNNVKIGFQASDDIAAVALHALTSETAPDHEYNIKGPEMLSYDDVAKHLTKVLGREYEHITVSKEDLIQRHIARGKPEFVAGLMGYLEDHTASGKEGDSVTDTVPRVTGRSAMSLDQFIEKYKHEFVN